MLHVSAFRQPHSPTYPTVGNESAARKVIGSQPLTRRCSERQTRSRAGSLGRFRYPVNMTQRM
jgi:hypothetical protein